MARITLLVTTQITGWDTRRVRKKYATYLDDRLEDRLEDIVEDRPEDRPEDRGNDQDGFSLPSMLFIVATVADTLLMLAEYIN